MCVLTENLMYTYMLVFMYNTNSPTAHIVPGPWETLKLFA